MTPLMKSCFWKVRGHNETTPLDEEFLLKGNDLLKSLRYSYKQECCCVICFNLFFQTTSILQLSSLHPCLRALSMSSSLSVCSSSQYRYALLVSFSFTFDKLSSSSISVLFLVQGMNLLVLIENIFQGKILKVLGILIVRVMFGLLLPLLLFILIE